MKPGVGFLGIVAAFLSVSTFGVVSSLDSQVHGEVIRTSMTDREPLVVGIRKGWYGYNPLTPLKRAFQVTSTFTQYGTAELTSITEAFLTELPRIEIAELRIHRTHYAVMDTVARVDGPAQFDLTR